MSHENYGFAGSTDSVGAKNYEIPIEKNTNKYLKDNVSSFNVVELESKNKVNHDLEKDYDPYKHRQVEHPTTYWETLFHLLKGSVGTGILAMPSAFHKSGWLVGVLGTTIIGLLCTYCIRILIKSEYELCKRRKVPSMTYPRTMEVSLQEGPRVLRPFSKFCPHITNTFLLVYQLGTCCIYTLFIADNLHTALKDHLWPQREVYLFAILLPLILINWIRNLKLLAPLSTFANGITFIGFGFILWFLFNEPLSFGKTQMVGDLKNFPFFLGTVLFALEAIGVIMPLENEMKSPKKFIKPAGVLNVGMGVNILLYVGMGFFGYLRFGNEVEDIITYNLGNDEKNAIQAKVVQILLAIAIFITHSLQCYVAIDITWNDYIKKNITHLSEMSLLFWEYVVRTFIVIITFIIAISVPKIDLLITLFGALCLSMLGISFPALIQICSFWKVMNTSERVFMTTKNVALIVFGILGLIVGTYVSLEKLINQS